MLIEIDDGLYIDPSKVVVVKFVEEEKCALWMTGQSAVDGNFLVNRSCAEVVEDVNEALSEDE